MQSYTAARLAGMTHISNTLSNIAAIDQRDKDKLDKILHDATKIWLEACTQRYRCFVIIPDDCIDVLKTQEATVPLRLVTKPELQRFGNLRGSDLSQGEVLAGWKSEVETYSIYH